MRRRALGLFALSGGVLLSEVVWTRLLSARTVHAFAFLAVSTALLGTAVGARWAARRTEDAPPDDRDAARLALGFAVSVPLAQVLSEAVGLELAGLRTDLDAWLRLATMYVGLAVPFGLAGAAIALVLARGRDALPQLYASDLIGAAAGALAALVLVPWCSGAPALWWGAALGAAAAAILCPAPGSVGLTALLIAAGLGGLPLPASVDPSKAPGVASFSNTLETVWTAHARLDRVPGRGGERWLIDGGVAAVRVPTRDAGASRDDAALVLARRPGGRVLVVGSGAGWEIADALHLGAARVVGVEVNPALVAATPEFIARDPRVSLVVDDARSYLERTRETFDVILMAHTITNAATAGGALGLTEDHVLTVEALRLVLERRAPEGLLLITRPAFQLPRLARTVVAAAGEPLSQNSWAWTDRGGGFFGALLVAQAWEATDVASLEKALRARARIFEHHPQRSATLPSLVTRLLKGTLPSAVSRADLRLEAATDDRPFFNRRWPLGRSWPGLGSAGASTRLVIEEQPLAELALLALLGESTILGLLVALWRRPRSARLLLPPAAVGAAFMAVEVSMLSILGLLLGDPSAAMAVGLAGLLIGAGLGSLGFGSKSPRFALGVAAGTAAAAALLAGPLAAGALALAKLARMALALILAAGIGGGLGGALPALLRGRDGAGAATGWAVNAAASVAGLALALLAAPEIGLSGLMLGAAALYLGTAAGIGPGKS